MLCNCMTLAEDYSLEFIQGDYVSYLYHLTNEEDEQIDNIDSVVFTCKRLGLEMNLQRLSPTDFLLSFPSELTETFPTYRGITYDITLKLLGDETPITLIHNASISISAKENTLNDDNEDNTDENV